MSDLRTPTTHDGDFFSKRVREYALERPLYPIQILEAGCGLGAGLDLGGTDRHVTGIDVDLPALRAHTRTRSDLDEWMLGDLRTAPLPPRGYDVVHAPFLIERIRNAELILDRFVAALKPGGLLLLRFRDRGSAYGFVDRTLPEWSRTLLRQFMHPRSDKLSEEFERRHSDEPLPVIYEPVTSGRGLRWYCVMRGLVISDEYTSRDKLDDLGQWRRLAGAVCRVVSAFSHGRLSAGHSEVTLVIRKPENRYARVI